MIQRIQTVYLLLTTVISVLFLSGNMLQFTDASGNVMGITIRGLLRYREGSDPEPLGSILPLIILISLIALGSLIIIFLFRNRKFQMKLTAGILILSVILIVAVIISVFFTKHEFDAEMIWSLKLLMPLLITLFLFFAYRGIRKDEELVKSYDRLR